MLIKLYKINRFIISAVWLVNGLYCKILQFVPRHKQIVGRILGEEYASLITILIGLAEVGMFIWILSGKYSRVNAMVQIAIIGLMNILEYVLAPDLLLWSKFNALFAFAFILYVYFNEFYLSTLIKNKW
jgi:hypothetical protein